MTIHARGVDTLWTASVRYPLIRALVNKQARFHYKVKLSVVILITMIIWL